MIYNKLVRDKIPEIIKSMGEKCSCHVASDEEYWLKLKEKLKEECEELCSGENYEEELADILEVINVICDYKNISLSDVEVLRKSKAGKRGGFKNKIILEES
jgi:predicted house-cleaning noncanonical NTP pyrophosphatase (MazG superfamily)